MFDTKTWMNKGWAFVKANQPEEACDLFAQAVAEARFLHNPCVLLEALMALGATESGLRHPATALDCYREAVDVAAHHRMPREQAEAMAAVAELLVEQKRTEEAATVCDQLLSIVQKNEFDAATARAGALRMLARLNEAVAPIDELALLWQAAATLYEYAGELDLAAECKSQLAFLRGQ